MTSASRPTRLGFLYPGYSAEDDYPWLASRLRPRAMAEVVHTSFAEDAHRVDALMELGGPKRLGDGAAKLRRANPASVIWACTSGSYVFGWDGAREQVANLFELLQVPCSSTSFSFVAAARALGVRRVAIAATYPRDVAELFVGFLEAGGIDTVGLDASGIVTAAEVGALDRSRVLELATQHDHPDADAVLLPDTALHTVRWLDDLEAAVGKPVITANQATIWHAWHLAGQAMPQRGFGALFRTDHAVADATF